MPRLSAKTTAANSAGGTGEEIGRATRTKHGSGRAAAEAGTSSGFLPVLQQDQKVIAAATRT